MKVLVTGGAGYIGSVTAAAMADAGHEVVVLDDLSTGHAAAVPSQARLVVGDVCDADRAARLMSEEGVEAVVHFAALSLVGDSMREPVRYYRSNVGGGLALLDACGRAGVRRFVLSSTAAVYGTPAAVPIPETAELRPESVYGETKLVLERALSWLTHTVGMGHVALRYFNAAGATASRGEDHRPETHLIPLVLRAALEPGKTVRVFGTDYDTADGTAVRDYVHVEDLAAAHVLAVAAAEPGSGRAYNLGIGEGFSVRQVIDVCRRVTGADIPTVEEARRAGDPPVLVADATRATAELGWRPRHTALEDIVASAWRWHRSHPAGYETGG